MCEIVRPANLRSIVSVLGYQTSTPVPKNCNTKRFYGMQYLQADVVCPVVRLQSEMFAVVYI